MATATLVYQPLLTSFFGIGGFIGGLGSAIYGWRRLRTNSGNRDAIVGGFFVLIGWGLGSLALGLFLSRWF